MACATVSAVSASAGLTTGRISASTSRQRICIVAGPAVRLQRNARPVAVKAVCDNRWGSSAGACGPMYSQRWRSGPNVQRSFDKWAEQASNNMWFPVDVEESAQEYTFVADVPGLGKNDIKVQVNKDRVLSISGERQQRSVSAKSASTSDSTVEVEGAEDSNSAQKVQRKRQERRFGTFKRTWNLPEDADVSQIKATVDQGVLSLMINRVQPVEPEVTTIPIN